EDVTQVTVAASAANLGPPHEPAVVHRGRHRLGRDRLVEARPAGSRVELRLRAEQALAAAGAPVHPRLLAVVGLARERPLGAVLAETPVLLRRELGLPLRVRPRDPLSHGASSLPAYHCRRARIIPAWRHRPSARAAASRAARWGRMTFRPS